MIDFETFTLENGLKVILYKTPSPIININIAYNVGSKDESSEHTGFAHLFEHLMFSGSVNIPSYDTPLQLAGGNNNAFTCQDYTNYYLSIPKTNLETGFWLESDRMLNLSFSEKGLEVQKKVVVEEFKQSYLNQPYGDTWLLIMPFVFKNHPYQWNTIGKNIEHVEKTTMKEVKDFFAKYYKPNNAIMSVVGAIDLENLKNITKKWFGDIAKGTIPLRALPQETSQTEAQYLTVHRDVPLEKLFIAFKIPERTNDKYHSYSILADILSNGDASRLYQKLVKDLEIAIGVSAFPFGHTDKGLFVIACTLKEGQDIKIAEAEIWKILDLLKTEKVDAEELLRAKNKFMTMLAYEYLNDMNLGTALAYFELLGDANLINTEQDTIQSIGQKDVQDAVIQSFKRENSSTLYYKTKAKI